MYCQNTSIWLMQPRYLTGSLEKNTAVSQMSIQIKTSWDIETSQIMAPVLTP